MENERDNDNILVRFLKDFLVYLPSIVIPLLVNMFALIIYTRVFPADQYGLYSLIVTNISVVVGVLTQWISQSTMRYRPEFIKNSNKLKIFNRNLTLLLILVNIVLFIISIPLYYVISDPLYKSLIWIAVIIIILEGIYSVLSVILKSDLRAKDFRFYNISLSLFKFLIALVFIYFVHKDISSLFYSNALVLLVIVLSIIHKIRINNIKEYILTFNRKNIKREANDFFVFVGSFWRYGIPMVGWFLGVSILELTDRYMLQLMRSSSELGIFSANNMLAKSATSVIASPIITSAQPLLMRLSSKDKHGIKKIEIVIKQFTELFLIALICPLVFVLVFHQEVGSVLLGKEYREGTIIIPILLIGLLMWHLALIGHKGYEIKEKTNIMLKYFVICIIANIGLNVILIPDYGYIGAAISTLICFTLYPTLIFINSKKYIKWDISIRNLIRIFLLIFFSTIFVNLIKDQIENFNVLIVLFLGIISSICVPIIFLILSEMIIIRTVNIRVIIQSIFNRIKIG